MRGTRRAFTDRTRKLGIEGLLLDLSLTTPQPIDPRDVPADTAATAAKVISGTRSSNLLISSDSYGGVNQKLRATYVATRNPNQDATTTTVR